MYASFQDTAVVFGSGNREYIVFPLVSSTIFWAFSGQFLTVLGMLGTFSADIAGTPSEIQTAGYFQGAGTSHTDILS